MKKLLPFLILIAFISSCKKDKDDDCTCPTPAPTTITPANNYFKLAVGNYWIYDDVKIDTFGVETPILNYDSAYVSADTVCRGNTYYKLFDLYYAVWLRDSSGYIVDTIGGIHFTNQVFDLPVVVSYLANSVGYIDCMTERAPVSVSVPVGSFTAYDWKITLHATDHNYQWGPLRYSHDYYASGIGKVKQRYFYYSIPDYFERRLTRYHVQ